MKCVLSFLFPLLPLTACDSGARGVASAAPEGTYVSSDGKVTLTFRGGRVSSESSLGNREGSFEMVDGIAKWQFDGGMPMTLKREEDGTWQSISGTKYAQK